MANSTRTSIGFVLIPCMFLLLVGCGSDDAGSPAAVAQATSGTSNGDAVETKVTIGGTPAAVVVAGATYRFSPTVANPSGATLSYSAQNIPAWAKFDNATGTMSGVPSANDVGVFSQIVVKVTDGTSSAALPSFSIAVTKAAAATVDALSIAGTPATSVAVGSAYTFHPTTAAAAGAKLTFSIVNKPVWATFDSATGTLSGTPAPSGVGVAANIAISVSDGTADASLASFSITVKAGPADSVTLSWTAPESNEDGSPVTDLVGYRVYYGTSENALTKVVTIEGANETKQVVNELPAGTWYFAVASVNSAKTESRLSAILPVTL